MSANGTRVCDPLAKGICLLPRRISVIGAVTGGCGRLQGADDPSEGADGVHHRSADSGNGFQGHVATIDGRQPVLDVITYEMRIVTGDQGVALVHRFGVVRPVDDDAHRVVGIVT